MRRPILDSRRKPQREMVAISVVIALPFVAVLAAIPVAWGWGISWHVLALTIGFYVLTMMGISTGFHRLLTHRSFKAKRPVRILLLVAGSLAIQGPVIRWVADHRRHHAFADRDGDPHSPWRYGTSTPAILRGMLHAHMGWFYDRDETNQEVFAADLLKDKDVLAVDRLSALLAVTSLALPSAIELGLGGSATDAVAAFFWAGLVRIFFVHHVTWSVNSICHTIGTRPFATRDRSANFWPLAILSMGDAWHNDHHAMPRYARHGMIRGQIDISAYFIAAFERLGWVTEVRWPPVMHRGTQAADTRMHPRQPSTMA
ncbi:MAG TPA: acyl-CoA desaturase [Candidatus Limnocylindrales bacterium]|nr:acyl-CoA desaturase [Candidatus Limnocylindrales bacterium]